MLARRGALRASARPERIVEGGDDKLSATLRFGAGSSDAAGGACHYKGGSDPEFLELTGCDDANLVAGATLTAPWAALEVDPECCCEGVAGGVVEARILPPASLTADELLRLRLTPTTVTLTEPGQARRIAVRGFVDQREVDVTTLGITLAAFGELHPEVLAVFDLPVPAVAFELDLDVLPKPKARPTKARPALEALPFPPVDRDFAFLVDAAVPAAKLLDAVRGAERKLVREVRLFDVYEGKGVPEGKRSLAVAVRLQAPDRTLAEAEIEAAAGRIVAAVEKATGASLRA